MKYNTRLDSRYLEGFSARLSTRSSSVITGGFDTESFLILRAGATLDVGQYRLHDLIQCWTLFNVWDHLSDSIRDFRDDLIPSVLRRLILVVPVVLADQLVRLYH